MQGRCWIPPVTRRPRQLEKTGRPLGWFVANPSKCRSVRITRYSETGRTQTGATGHGLEKWRNPTGSLCTERSGLLGEAYDDRTAIPGDRGRNTAWRFNRDEQYQFKAGDRRLDLARRAWSPVVTQSP